MTKCTKQCYSVFRMSKPELPMSYPDRWNSLRHLPANSGSIYYNATTKYSDVYLSPSIYQFTNL